MASRLIGLVGYARTGKDTVADYLVRQHGFTKLASADLLRDVLYGANPLVARPETYSGRTASVPLRHLVDGIGWERAKLEFPDVRRLLQDLGTEGVRAVLGADTWINETLKRAALIPGPVVISDTRFPNEARLTKDQGGQTWRIDRPGVGPVNGHASEAHIMSIPVDRVVTNDGSIGELGGRIDDALVTVRYEWNPLVGAWPEWKAYSPSGSRHFTGGPKNVGL